MPNWIDDNDFSWFGKLECKRCLQVFTVDKSGEVPTHKCIGGYYKSYSPYGEYHIPMFVGPLK